MKSLKIEYAGFDPKQVVLRWRSYVARAMESTARAAVAKARERL